MQIHQRLEDEEIPKEIRQRQKDGLKGKGNLSKHERLLSANPSKCESSRKGDGTGQSLSGSKAGRVQGVLGRINRFLQLNPTRWECRGEKERKNVKE